MKVLLLGGIFPPDIGGPATYLPLLATHLVAAGWEVHLITMTDGATRTERQEGFVVTRISRSSTLFMRCLKLVFFGLWHGQKASVIFANGLFGVSAMVSFLLRKPLIIKVVGDPAWERAQSKGLTNADIVTFQKSFSSFRVALLKFLRNQSFRRASHVVVPSEFLAVIVRSMGLRLRGLSVVYNGVSVDVMRAESVARSDYFVCVARLVPWKGIREVIEACIMSRVRLVVVGDGPLSGELKKFVDGHDSNKLIAFVGVKPRQETLALISESKGLILNSSYEGLSHVLLEACALGVPVIARKAGGNAECVVDGASGYLVERGTSEELNAKIQLLNGNGALPGFSAARASLLGKFSQQKMLSDTAAILEQYAKKRA